MYNNNILIVNNIMILLLCNIPFCVSIIIDNNYCDEIEN